MKFLTPAFGCFLVILQCSCGTPSAKLGQLSVGMTKSEVMSVLGQPTSVRASGNTEFLVYDLYEKTTVQRSFFGQGYLEHRHGEYYIKVIDGKVAAYGKQGDFDSKDSLKQEESQTINIKIR